MGFVYGFLAVCSFGAAALCALVAGATHGGEPAAKWCAIALALAGAALTGLCVAG